MPRGSEARQIGVKLGVTGRAEAIERARHLRLIWPPQEIKHSIYGLDPGTAAPW